MNHGAERARSAAELLPPSAQRDWLQATLDRILSEPLRTPTQLAKFHLDRADGCHRLAGSMQDRSDMLQKLSDQERYDRDLAAKYQASLPPNYPPRFARHAELLLAWESAGGDLCYKRDRKRIGERRYPDPTGPVVSFLVIAAEVKPGTTHNIILRYRGLQLTPIATKLTGRLAGTIDESKISVIDKNSNPVQVR